MNKESGIASGRLGRPLALLLLALIALTWTGAAAAVSPSQELVVLLGPHPARWQPAVRSATISLVPARTPITGERTVLPVLARKGHWLRVRLPGRPNGHTGWISQAATGRSVTAWHLLVDRTHRRVTVYRAGRPVRVFRAIVGKPSTPTPSGEYFVEESIALRAADVGAPFALALSARSDVLQEFGGGPGQIALHGLGNIGGLLGSAVSHGCVRLDNDVMRWLVYRIGPGVPVSITG